MSEKKYQLFQQKEQISKKYTILAPESPDKNDRYQYVSRSIPETPEKLMGAIAAVEPGKRVVEIFGDKNCKIKHYVDFEAEFDSYDKVINNCVHYLELAGSILSKSMRKPNDQEIIWLSNIMKNWSYLEMPNISMSNWQQIAFPVWKAIMDHICHGNLLYLKTCQIS